MSMKLQLRRRAKGGELQDALFLWKESTKKMVPVVDEELEFAEEDEEMGITDERVEELRVAFDLFDADSSGAISSDELRIAMSAMG